MKTEIRGERQRDYQRNGRERESGIRESLNGRKENREKRRKREREHSKNREGECERL